MACIIYVQPMLAHKQSGVNKSTKSGEMSRVDVCGQCPTANNLKHAKVRRLLLMRIANLQVIWNVRKYKILREKISRLNGVTDQHF